MSAFRLFPYRTSAEIGLSLVTGQHFLCIRTEGEPTEKEMAIFSERVRNYSKENNLFLDGESVRRPFQTEIHLLFNAKTYREGTLSEIIEWYNNLAEDMDIRNRDTGIIMNNGLRTFSERDSSAQTERLNLCPISIFVPTAET